MKDVYRGKKFTSEQLYNALNFVFTDVFEKKGGDIIDRLIDEIFEQIIMDRELRKIFERDWRKKDELGKKS